VNANCHWIGDRAFPVNWTDATHRRHLVDDVRLAGENAIRFGDAARTRVGLEGTVPRRDACLDTLYGTISLNHGVDRALIDDAERTRTLAIDAALVWAPMAILFLLGTNLLSHRLLRVMPAPDERWTKIALLVWIGVATSALAVLVTHLWGWYVEELRLRTNHLSFRARTLPVSLNVWTAYFGAMVLFIGVAARQYRSRLSRAAAGESRDALAGWRR
jgi:hypothetical protein